MPASHSVFKFLVFLLAAIGADAFPGGALATCAAGAYALAEAVQQFGGHCFSGPLEQEGTTFSINGMTLEAGMPVSFPTDQDLPFIVQASADRPFKGILIRLDVPDGVETAAAFSDFDEDNLQISTTCMSLFPAGNIVGLTHKNPAGDDAPERFEVTGTIRFDETAQDVKVDITVVYEKDRGYYSSYSVSFEGPPIKPPPPDCENGVTDFYLINPALDDDDENFKIPLPDVIDLAKFPRGKIIISWTMQLPARP